MTATTSDGKALRAWFNEILADHPSVTRELAERLSGVDLAYPPPADGNLLAGRRMPDLVLADAPVERVPARPSRRTAATDLFTSIPSRCADSISFSRNFTATFDAV
ncbi:MAG: hypothetical protein ACRDSO_01230 [Pseudonocardiaceae bacterium]